MLTPQAIGFLVVGILACFMGYSMFRTMLPLWGFILGGWIAFTFLPSFFRGPNMLIIQSIGFFVGGLIGAVLATPLYFGVVFVSGALGGVVLGTVIGAVVDAGGVGTVAQVTRILTAIFPPIPHSFVQYAFSLLGGGILGFTAMNFQKFMIISTSSFLGAAAIMSGLSVPIAQSARTVVGQGSIMMAGWIAIGLIGMFVQFRLTGDV